MQYQCTSANRLFNEQAIPESAKDVYKFACFSLGKKGTLHKIYVYKLTAGKVVHKLSSKVLILKRSSGFNLNKIVHE